MVDDPAGGSVKLSIVSAQPENLLCLDAGAAPAGPRLAGLQELFRLKCIAAADRTRSRDWLDLFLLLFSGLFGHEDFIDAYERAGVPQKREIALMRMVKGKLPATDEGFSTLLPSPPGVEDMQAYFQELADAVQQELAARQFAQPRASERNG